ncbi:MAG: hypothetical protein CL916_03665 [Deltaproteobacteria bacterium]|nr:hypothetical protein [Deltaproteobacteria bacterium]
MFCLEVQKFTDQGFAHVGYMNALFYTSEDADAYYKIHNKHMRGITQGYQDSHSDEDPDSHLRYVIRKYDNEICNVTPFDPRDAPTTSATGINSFPDLPRAPRPDYVRLPFAKWLRNLRSDDDDGYVYLFGEVEDFLNDVDMTCITNDYDTWECFCENELPDFEMWSDGKKQAAANTYFEWRYGRGGRQLSPKYFLKRYFF